VNISFEKLNYTFVNKPLLVGGMAMEYYGLRKSGDDIDFVAQETDILNLIRMYPDRVKHLWGDLGICPFEFEIWKTICLLDYDYLKEQSIELENYLVISREKLLLMKTLGIKKEKYLNDVKLIVESIFKEQNPIIKETIKHNEDLLKDISGITYIERSVPLPS
jgi:hypothetical protein